MKMRQTKIPRYSFVLEKTSGQSVRSNQPLPSVLSTDPDQEGESKQGTVHRKMTITLGTLTQRADREADMWYQLHAQLKRQQFHH